jgi:DNA (cytosine-5)-methyltransferase 1
VRPAYYNEIDPFAVQWLRNLIAAGHLPDGDVDTRSIADVRADDLVGYAQCHFFAGIGGWALAARLAGWPDDRELWTGSCPCQPFSVAGKGAGTDDERHLWPHQFRLIRARRPAVWMGEQVAAAVGKDWLDGVLADLEGVGYAGRAAVVPACAVDGPHRRDRLWIVADRDGAVGHGEREGLEGLARHGDDQAGRAQQDRPAAATGRGSCMADADLAGACPQREQRGGELGGTGGDPGARAGYVAYAHHPERRASVARGHEPDRKEAERDEGNSDARQRGASAWIDHAWIIGHDGKARRVEPSIRLLAHGVPARVGRLRAYGNAIVPQVAAEVIGAYLEAVALCTPRTSPR